MQEPQGEISIQIIRNSPPQKVAIISKKTYPETNFSKKVFRTPSTYASPIEHMKGLAASLGQSNSRQLEFDTVDLFKRKGYIIEKDGTFNNDNPEEIGIDSNLIPRMNQLELDEFLSGKSGIEMPKRLQLKEVNESNEPIVAKRIGEHGGNSVYILETRKQKARFISWLLSMYDVKSTAQLEKLIKQVQSGDLTPNSKNSAEDNWLFEEYIETPSDYNTSFRILTDCFGKVHYGILIRSEQEKGVKKIQDVLDVSGTKLTSKNIVDLATLPGVSTEVLLNAPSSPLYLGAKSIVSNVIKGGRRIFLNGGSVSDIKDREILTAHHIDPNKPQIPQELVEASSKIGPECRGDYPFVGIDFLLGKDGKYYYLETNLGPGLAPELIGLPPESDPGKAQLHLMEKIISSK